LAWALVPLSVLGLLIAFDLPVCPSRIVLGIPCPGCGLTRATEAMFVGNFAVMLRMHPLAPIIAPVAVFSIGRTIAVSAGFLGTGSLDPLGRIPSWVWGIVGIVLIGLWVARMFGLFGGLPDPLDISAGLLWRGVSGLWDVLPGEAL